ncbi:MAG: tetratricopeptide repeat protein [bacterium]
MELFLRKLKRTFEKLFGVSFFVGLLVVLFMFSGIILLNFKRVGAFCYVYMGDKFSQKHEYQESINYYKRALELYPGHVKARYNLGNIYVAYEDYDSAIDCYNKALLYDPNYLNARINLGILLSEERSDIDAAIYEYKKVTMVKIPFIRIPFIYDNAALIKDEKAIAYYNMGLAYRDKSLLYGLDSVEAHDFLMKSVDCYKQALALKPKNYDAQYNLALTYHLLDMYSEALGGYCHAMLIAPLNYESYYNFAILLRQKGKYDEAVDEFRRAGNLSSYNGDTSKAAFIYDVLNEVSAMAIAQHGFESEKVMDRLSSDLTKEAKDLQIAEDKAVTVEELEKILIKSIKTNSICKDYLENK